MKALVMKDLKVIGPLMNLGIITLIFLVAFINSLIGEPFVRGLIYLGFLLFMLQVVFATIGAHDKVYKTHMIFHSLPMDKKIIVESKYIIGIVYNLFISLTFFGMSYFLGGASKNIEMYSISLEDLLNMFSIGILFISINLPSYYHRSHKEISSKGLELFLVPIFLVLFTKSLDNKNIIHRVFVNLYRIVSAIDLRYLPYILLPISLILCFISMRLSIKLYKNEE